MNVASVFGGGVAEVEEPEVEEEEQAARKLLRIPHPRLQTKLPQAASSRGLLLVVLPTAAALKVVA